MTTRHVLVHPDAWEALTEWAQDTVLALRDLGPAQDGGTPRWSLQLRDVDQRPPRPGPPPAPRHTADSITDTALDQLYAERDHHWWRGQANHEAFQHWKERAEQAEAAIERVRERCQAVRDSVGPSGMINASQILGLLSPTWPDGNYAAPNAANPPQETP